MSRPRLYRPARVGVFAALSLGCVGKGCGGEVETPAPTAPSSADNADNAAQTPDLAPQSPVRDDELPVLTEEALAARVSAQTRYLGGRGLFEDATGRPVELSVEEATESVEDDLLDGLPGSAGLSGADEVGGDVERVNGNALGLFVPIEHPRGGDSLAHFHTALRELKAGTDRKVRIAVYGGSHTQADVYTGYLRTYLQERFGNGGYGFLPIVKVSKWQKPVGFMIDQTRNWLVEHAQRTRDHDDGRMGLAGWVASSRKKSNRSTISPSDPSDPHTHASNYEIYYLEQPRGGSFSLRIDGANKAKKIKTKAKTFGAGYAPITLPLGPHSFEFRPSGDGEVRLFGMTVERDEPGVVVDTLGISGTRAANHLKWDEDLWAEHLQRRDPDLYIFFYGTNEATDANQDIAVYKRKLAKVLDRYREAAPEASCLLMGPGDFPRKNQRGMWVARPRVQKIINIQRELAYEKGCGFWDTRAFMGGVGSMETWANARPQMASGDHIHFTRRGYVRIGMALADALMIGFDSDQPAGE